MVKSTKKCLKCKREMPWDEYCHCLGRGFREEYLSKLRRKGPRKVKNSPVDRDIDWCDNSDYQLDLLKGEENE